MVSQEKLERINALIAGYEALGVEEPEHIFNELMRFRYIDQLIASKGKEFTLSLDELYTLAEEETVKDYGKIPFPKESFGKAYQLAFSASLFEVIEGAIAIEGLAAGLDLGPALTPVLTAWQAEKGKGKILCAHVEEYGGYVEEILQRFGADRVVFQAETKAANLVLRRLFPQANIVVDLPITEQFEHILFIHRGTFEDSAKSMIDSIAMLGKYCLSPEGTAAYFIDVRAFYDDPEQEEVWKEYFKKEGFTERRWADFFYQNRRLTSITEWLPLEVWQLSFGKEESDKIALKFAEIKEDEDEIIDKKLIPLHRERILETEHFSLVDYALACCSYIPPKGDTTLVYAWCLDEVEGAPWRHTWDMDAKNAALWAAFMDTKYGKQIDSILWNFAGTEESYMQLLMGIRRPILPAEVADAIAAMYWQGITTYERELQAAEDKWQEEQHKIVEAMEKEF